MRTSLILAIVPVVVVASACGRRAVSAMDDGLKNDLALASQAQSFNPQFANPAEQGNGQSATGYATSMSRSTPRQPVYTSSPRRASATRGTGSSTSGSGGVYRQPAPEEPVRHTRRDAAIGATAGAVIGATTSRDKVKGGLVGAVVGGVLGGVVGHTVDVERRGGGW
jgi:YMGG-like Gly-zipper